MKYVSIEVLKEISLGSEVVSVTTQGGGQWDLTPQHAAKVLEEVMSLPKGRQVEKGMMGENRNIFARIHREALNIGAPKVEEPKAEEPKPKKGHKQAIEKAPEDAQE